MKSSNTYSSPTAKEISLAVESILCASSAFGEDGSPGNDFFDMDDITDGGSF